MSLQNSKSQKPVLEKEVRFAVVMYGGVSLAIYINGVAQELYKLVRATARKRNEDGSWGDYFIDKPASTESVYRTLGELLRARFVVDILSGTSAGGINAIFLAKALANDQPMSQLEKLWVEQGDIELLINDRASVADLSGLQVKPPPSSLLNSQRMYYQLLAAFDEMDKSAPRSRDDLSPFVDELDLFVTATDIRGLWLPIPLADEETHEYRYRTVFRFFNSTLEEPGDRSQDFLKVNNPFLAFAARATSSFPFAFEPIKLEDVSTVLDARNFVQNYPYTELKKEWQRFYKDYNSPSESIDSHSFGDGGYLDNKPFSYITETLLRRRADTPVDRRLFYIEPAPEHQRSHNLSQDDRPNAIENVAAALVDLPRYETIRDDLLQIKARNDLIERTNAILRQIERARGGVGSLKIWEARGSDWSGKYLDELISDYGSSYAAYHQLRVADTLDDFAAAVARNIGMDEEGQSFKGLRQIFEQWRKRKYSSSSKENCFSENDLLFRLDLRWRVRRLYFLMRTIDDILLGLSNSDIPAADPSVSRVEQEQKEYAEEIIRKSGVEWNISDEAIRNQYFEALAWVKRELNRAFLELRVRGRKLRARNLASQAITQIADPDLKAHVQAIQPLMPINDQAEAILLDEKRLASICEDIETLSLSLASRPTKGEKPTGYLCQTMSLVSHLCKEALDSEDGKSLPGVPEIVLKNVRDSLRFYYDHFEYFDMLTFPITYATPIGESDVVDVYRISPEDAKGLFNAQESKRPKLAGTKLGNFGAFFKKEWRENDIMWGRLDGAERIICTLLPDSPKRNELLLRAWLTILKENLDLANLKSLQDHLGSALDHFGNAAEPSAEEMMRLQEGLRTYFQRDYVLNLEFSPQTTMNALGRSIQVIGGVLDGLGQKYQGVQAPAFWLTRLGKIFMGVMQVAIPGSLPRLFFQHWIKITYVFELFLIVVGALLGFNNTVMRFGILSLFITLSIDLAVRLVGNNITGSTRSAILLRGLAKFVVVLVLLALILLVYLGLVYLRIAELPGLRIFGT
ncbi:MAG TPA: patatin-like protein [Anaerolineales bacterium]|nr:patatin-like protein [Anaerolineales bacterium]